MMPDGAATACWWSQVRTAGAVRPDFRFSARLYGVDPIEEVSGIVANTYRPSVRIHQAGQKPTAFFEAVEFLYKHPLPLDR